jgi:hypothetical protein
LKIGDEIPAETASFRSTTVSAVREDWMVEVIGLELETHHPVIEPVSASRRERKFLMQRQAGKHSPFACKRPILETGPACEMPPFQRNKCN